ncbi:MAG: enoyl-CoA hydratase-related protein [Vicinamibacterales bacterium]
MAASYRHLDVRRDGAVEHVTLNRPDVRNAFNAEVIRDLATWARSARSAEGLRVVVLSGAGKIFSAGADIAWMKGALAYTEDENYRDARATTEMLHAIDTLPVPVIGRIHGAALGGGCGLAAVCDIVVAGADAVFGFTETKLGILPSLIAPYAIAKIGVSAARELFLTGARFSAVRAREIGLVHAVVPEDELDATIEGYVRELLGSAPSGIAAAKALIPDVVGRAPADVMELTSRTIARQRVSPEGQEGLRAFLEKRKPAWHQ